MNANWLHVRKEYDACNVITFASIRVDSRFLGLHYKSYRISISSRGCVASLLCNAFGVSVRSLSLPRVALHRVAAPLTLGSDIEPLRGAACLALAD